MGTGALQNIIPEWLTKSFLQNILNNFYGISYCTVNDFNSTVVSSKTSENNTYFVYKVFIQLERDEQTENLSLLFKVASDNHLDREIHFYENILPDVKAMLENVGDLTVITPKCFYVSQMPTKIIATEDLKSADYSKHQEGRLLNLEHALLVLGKIAKLHACTAVLHQNKPELFELFSVKPNTIDEEFIGNLKSLNEEVALWAGYEEIADKLLEIDNNLFEREQEAFLENSNDLRVSNHNNLWLDNIMFQYDSHTPQEVLLLNYRSMYFGSPGIDLNYFLYGSVNENCRKIHFKYMVREYHRILKDTLEKLKYRGKIPTLKDIHIEMIRKSFHAVIAAIGVTPHLLNTINDDFVVLGSNEFVGQDDEEATWTTTRYKKYIQKLLKEFDLLGYLD